MRGKLLLGAVSLAESGITPADAGKTNPPCIVCGNSEDHPRGCGENRVRFWMISIIAGSPPRMRGKPPEKLPESLIKRITPADAGKTAKRDKVVVVQPGSPPRMRGKRSLHRIVTMRRRITPADAGKTCKWQSRL